MLKKENFFQKLQKYLPNSKQSARFIQELNDHLEDKKEDQAFTSKMIKEINPYDLGEPQKLAAAYKRAMLMTNIQYFSAIIFFLLVLFSVEVVCADNTFIGFSENTNILTFIIFYVAGLIFMLLAAPVTLITILIQTASNFLLGYDLNTFWVFRIYITPLLIALYHTSIYFVFFCKPFWGKKKISVTN